MTFHEYTVFMNSYKQPDKPRRPRTEPPAPPLTAVRLLDQVRERIRYKHYSLRTEQQYVYWVRAFVRFHGLSHPREMGACEEVSSVLAAMEGPMADLASLVYGTGMRLMESLRLRVKDVDFERRLIVVREGKGN